MTLVITSPPHPKVAEAKRESATVRKTEREREKEIVSGRGIGMKRKDGTVILKNLRMMKRLVSIFQENHYHLIKHINLVLTFGLNCQNSFLL